MGKCMIDDDRSEGSIFAKYKKYAKLIRQYQKGTLSRQSSCTYVSLDVPMYLWMHHTVTTSREQRQKAYALVCMIMIDDG